VFPVEQIVYVPCLRKVIAPNKLVSAGDEMKDVLRVRDRPTCTRLDIAECESKVELAGVVSNGKVIRLSSEAVGCARCERGPQTRYPRVH